MRVTAAENRLTEDEVTPGPRFSQIVLETVQSFQGPESSFEKRTPHEPLPGGVAKLAA
jgi:hypothetical protein